MLLTVKAHGPTPEDMSLQWGHYLVDGCPTIAETRRQVIAAIIDTLRAESDRLAGDDHFGGRNDEVV